MPSRYCNHVIPLHAMKKIKQYSFQDFLAYFPVIELPTQLTDDAIFDFQRVNDPLPEAVIHQFIVPIEKAEPNEFTEFVPCFRIPNTQEIEAIIYWKAELMRYQYVLTTFDKKGDILKSATIAGIQSDGDFLLQSVAHIDEDWIIDIVEGSKHTNSDIYDPQTSRKYSMELLATGEIIFLNNENPN